MLLIQFRSNYADEFDVSGFILMSQEDWDKHLKIAENRFKDDGHVELYFGTNESLEFDSFKHYKSSFKVTELSESEASFMEKTFPSAATYGYGTIVMIEDEDCDEEESEKDDEDEV